MITASLGLDWSNFQSGIQGAISSIQMLSGGASIFGALTIAVKGFYDAIQFGDDLVDLNAQTGVAIDKLIELQMAFDLNGMKADQLQPVIAKMQRIIAEAGSGSAEAAAKFSMMGIQIADIQGLNADEQLMKIGEAIEKIQNPAQRSAMAMEIFGKSGAKLLSVFAAGGMEEVRKVLGNQTALLLENAGVFGKASDILGLTGSKIRGFFVGIASEIVPQIMDVLEKSAKLDFSKIGQGIGAGVAFWINYFDNFGATGDLIYNTLKLAFANAINFFAEELAVNMAVSAAGLRNYFSSDEKKFKAMQEAEIQARTSGLVVDTTNLEKSIQATMDAINASKEANAAEARKKYATPGAAPTGMDILRKLAPTSMPQMIASSAAKVGALGGAVWGGEQDINVQRDILAVQQRIANSIDRFLQTAKPENNPYLSGVTPQLGII
jgi:hypothetical protein